MAKGNAMAFNSQTYYRNRWRKDALAELERAREIKARVAAGAACEWEAARIATCVKCARISWRLYLSAKRIAQIEGRGK